MTKARRTPVPSWRIIAGGLILAAVVVIVGFKAGMARGGRSSAAASVTGLVYTVDGAISVSPSVYALYPDDPFPADAAGQLQWVERHQAPAMVLFRSTGCIPCQRIRDVVETVRADYEPGIVFVTILTDDPANMALVREAGIQTIPTSFFIDGSAQGTRVLGAMDAGVLGAYLRSIAGE